MRAAAVVFALWLLASCTDDTVVKTEGDPPESPLVALAGIWDTPAVRDTVQLTLTLVCNDRDSTFSYTCRRVRDGYVDGSESGKMDVPQDNVLTFTYSNTFHAPGSYQYSVWRTGEAFDLQYASGYDFTASAVGVRWTWTRRSSL